MHYVIRSTTGLTISEGNKEKVFHTKEEAKLYISFLQFQMIDQWSIVEVKKDL